MNVEYALEQLKNNGFKLTDKREFILNLFAENKRYMSAKEVMELLKMNIPGLSYDTIYRNLALFTTLNILESTDLEGEKKFRLTCSGSKHHHHLICLSCNKTKHVDECPMTSITLNSDDFEIVDHKFEIYGYCKECQHNSKS
ncbi:transcriptional repressor [Lottiidibacillus patelloidae]|uniref:Transcriptional repressor n=1 Tax=Lottiidibacillus patelloidae TaxID=2670334 RepID=A0A263BWZ3_9BACI|nr:Fur family transcriptional regulator [Lottiidibacillus patelloidae]OZM57706.1 transcriptional repressor [Lottiidibacillus patelloidae]